MSTTVAQNRRRRYVVGFMMITFGLAVAFITGLITSQQVQNVINSTPAAQPSPLPQLASVQRVPPVSGYATARSIPVLAYHALDDRCAASEVTCRSADYESVSLRQFRDEMAWLYERGYHTVTMSQYLEWLLNRNTLLPADPVLLIEDNGDADFLLGAEPVLYHYRYTVTSVIVTGFANAATTGYCLPRMKVAGRSWNVQYNCGGPNSWNATWPQLRALSPQVYDYALEAGPIGHFVQQYSTTCIAYYACRLPGETTAAYEHDVTADITTGRSELASELGDRVSSDAWVVPYSDLGYACPRNLCPEEITNAPRDWLGRWAARFFTAVFVQTPTRNGIQHERFRYEIHNTTTLAQFGSAISKYTKEGDFRWR